MPRTLPGLKRPGAFSSPSGDSWTENGLSLLKNYLRTGDVDRDLMCGLVPTQNRDRTGGHFLSSLCVLDPYDPGFTSAAQKSQRAGDAPVTEQRWRPIDNERIHFRSTAGEVGQRRYIRTAVVHHGERAFLHLIFLEQIRANPENHHEDHSSGSELFCHFRNRNRCSRKWNVAVGEVAMIRQE